MNVDEAIARQRELTPGAEIGRTASPGGSRKWYERMQRMGSVLHVCACGQRLAGWRSPEFSARDGRAIMSVGYDATSNIISCGPFGWHSERYANDQPCWERT
jgi:hypothetical protein